MRKFSYSLHYDPEIERTFHVRRREQRGRKHTMDRVNPQVRPAIQEDLPEHQPQHFGNPPREGPYEAVGRHNDAHNPIFVADDREIVIQAYSMPTFDAPGIVGPDLEAAEFELKPVMFQMLQSIGQFHGLPSEDPHLHLRNFLSVSDSFKKQGVSKDARRLILFPYSLQDQEKSWLNSFGPGFITSWNDLAEKLLMKYFPPTKNAKLRGEIVTYKQFDDENFSERWERFKELLRKCHHHGLPHCIQMETFYNGLNLETQNMVNASANGALIDY